MTTPFQAWHKQAMMLANDYASAEAAVYWEADQGWLVDRLVKRETERDAARAALSAHLLAVPMGERVGYFQTDSMGQTYQVGAEFAGDPDVFQLFTKPEGMA